MVRLEWGIYPGLVFELGNLDLEEIADALADQPTTSTGG